MKRMTKNKKLGFTLVELMLALAIMLLISGLFVSLILATHESYYTTYNYNDASDYCQMYAKIISDQILSDRQDTGFTSGQSRTYWMNPGSCQFELSGSGTAIVEMPRVYNRDGTLKWIFAVSDVRYDSAHNVADIDITVIDNYHNPGEPLFTYTFSVWIPNQHKWGDTTKFYGDRISVVAGSNNPVQGVNNYEIVVNKL